MRADTRKQLKFPAMKKLVSMVLAAVALTSIISCSTNDQTMNTNDIPGLYVVHFFKNDGVDQTSNYNGYTFNFATNGSLTATKQSVATPGTWSKFTDSGRDKLQITWMGGGVPTVLLEIEEDWIIKSNSSGLLVLADTSGSSGKVKELHMQKQ